MFGVIFIYDHLCRIMIFFLDCSNSLAVARCHSHCHIYFEKSYRCDKNISEVLITRWILTLKHSFTYLNKFKFIIKKSSSIIFQLFGLKLCKSLQKFQNELVHRRYLTQLQCIKFPHLFWETTPSHSMRCSLNTRRKPNSNSSHHFKLSWGITWQNKTI